MIMASTDRKGCILPPSVADTDSTMTMEKIQRLRVNRVAFIQSLRVEHVLNHLLAESVITAENRDAILAVKSGQDKARVLVDLLPKKFPGKNKDWYAKFREALKNPETRSKEVKKKYEMLVEFLDNTIIHVPRPKTPISKSDENVREKSFPRYQPLPRISSQGSEKGENEEPEHRHKDDTLEHEDGSCAVNTQQNPGNISSRIVVPQGHFDQLLKGMTAEDLAQLEKEKIALERIQHVETMYELDRQGLVQEDQEFSLSKSVAEFLSDASLYHYYFKYLTKLKLDHTISLLGEISGSFCNYLSKISMADNDEEREKLTDIGFKLYRITVEFGDTNKAEFVLLSLMQYLSTCSKLENWMALWEGLVCMMSVSNENVDFKQTDANYHLVQAMGDKIKSMSFGLDLLDESTLFCEMSVMMREQGSLGPAYKWAQKAIEEVEAENEAGIVDVLCTASAAYAMYWDVKGAKQLAIEAISRAKFSFGTRHPLYEIGRGVV